MKARGRLFLVVVLVVLAITVFEELQLGQGYVLFVNHYQKIVFRNISVRRESPRSIAIVVIVSSRADEENYPLALDTVKCYTEHFGYPFHLIHVMENATLLEKCPQKDASPLNFAFSFMFQRHCVLAVLLPSISNDWVLFLDADMGIINPNHLIEDYVPLETSKVQLVFYNRIMNYEIMAGSYLLRNGQYAIDFLKFWANYETKLPNSFHGTDNGAIHSAILEFALPNEEKKRIHCERTYWNKAKNYFDLTIYEICIQRILQRKNIAEISLLPKGRKAWARDGWLTNSAWCERDFFLHGWQRRRLDRRVFASWHSPVDYQRRFNFSMCADSNAFLNWRYKDSFIKSVVDIDRQLYIGIKTAEEESQRIFTF